jgi:hypothetical protein
LPLIRIEHTRIKFLKSFFDAEAFNFEPALMNGYVLKKTYHWSEQKKQNYLHKLNSSGSFEKPIILCCDYSKAKDKYEVIDGFNRLKLIEENIDKLDKQISVPIWFFDTGNFKDKELIKTALFLFISDPDCPHTKEHFDCLLKMYENE